MSNIDNDELTVRNILYGQAGQSQIPEKYVDEYIKSGNKAIWEFIEVYVTTRVKEAERLARIDELERWMSLAYHQGKLDGNWMWSNELHSRIESLTTTTNGKGQ